jgi:hypothetical protein
MTLLWIRAIALASAGEVGFVDELRRRTVAARHFWRRQQTTKAYTAEQIDILAAYIVPVDAWYIIPVGAFTPSECLSVFPHIPGHGGTYEKFLEAWFPLACRRGGEPKEGIVTLPACGYSAGLAKRCVGCRAK